MYDLSLQQVLLRVMSLLIVVALHGLLLAGCARALGDRGPQQDGRLTASPFVHVDLIGLLSGVLFQAGWMRRMDVDPDRLRFGRAGLLLCIAVSIGGLLLFALLLQLLQAPAQWYLSATASQDAMVFIGVLSRTAIWFGLFNLLPIPPLTGSLLWGLVSPRALKAAHVYAFIGAGCVVTIAASGLAARLLGPAVEVFAAAIGAR